MQNRVVKFSVILLFLLVYLNRGLFITPYELENSSNEELNSVVEWITQLITGESNDIDEDGDLQSDCFSVSIDTYNFSQELVQYFDLLRLHSKSMGKIAFPDNENILQNGYYTLIDHPPEII
ncbi:MAG: hypothetical protein LBU83_08580 [Bacteroidales bacterium]|jgi:hypothetical protein|nr:hypothetical protein [Bacteroidales bacterium]